MIPLPLLALILGVPLALVGWYVWNRGDNSAQDDTGPLSASQGAAAAGTLSGAIGWPYYFGRGAPSTPWDDGPLGVDCSGFAQMALVRLGILSSDATDRGARTLADDSDPVDVGSQSPGDLAYYPGHVAVVVGYPGTDGHSSVMCASGHATTFGDVEGEQVNVYSSALYRSDFVTYMRLRT